MNILAIVVAAVVSFVFSWLWYGPVFGKTWMKLSGMTMEDMKSMNMSPAKAMTLGFISVLITAYVLSMFMNMLSISETMAAIKIAFWIWLGFAVPIQAGVWLWEGKSFHLFIFNSAYQLIAYAIIAAALLLV